MASPLRGKQGALFLLTSVELIVFLDVSIVNVALPAIGATLGMAVVGLAWVGTAYQVAFGGFQLGAGRATDVLGRRRLFEAGLVVFTLGSLFAGLATWPWMLIAARVLQGVGAAILVPAELSLLTAMFTEPAAYRRAFGWWSAMGALGAGGGVVLGGLIVELFSWPWIFLMNVPIGLAGLLWSRRLLPADPPRDSGPYKDRRLNLPGIATGTGALLLIVYAITVAAEGRLDPLTVLLGLTGLLLAVAFVYTERRSVDPLLPLRLFRNPDVTGSTLASVVVGAAHVPAFVFIALHFQRVQGYTALESGLAVLPIAVVGFLVSRFVVPRALEALGPRGLLTLGMGTLALGLALLTRLSPGAHFATGYLPGALIFAVGLPAVFVASTLPAVKAVSENETGVVSAVVNTAQRVGAGLGLAVLAAMAKQHTASVTGGETAALSSGYRLTFGAAAAIALVGLAIGLWLVWRGRRMENPSDETSSEAEPDASRAAVTGSDA